MEVGKKRSLFWAAITVVASAVVATVMIDYLWRQWAVFTGILIGVYLVSAVATFRPRRWSFKEDLFTGCFFGIALGTASWAFSLF